MIVEMIGTGRERQCQHSGKIINRRAWFCVDTEKLTKMRNKCIEKSSEVTRDKQIQDEDAINLATKSQR